MRILSFILCFLLSSCWQEDHKLELQSGNSINWSDLRGQWVYIHYWAPWCKVCIKEAPTWNQFVASTKNKPIKVFLVNKDHKNPMADDLLGEVLKTDPKHALKLGDIPVFPMTFVFNPRGKLVETIRGPKDLSKR